MGADRAEPRNSRAMKPFISIPCLQALTDSSLTTDDVTVQEYLIHVGEHTSSGNLTDNDDNSYQPICLYP